MWPVPGPLCALWGACRCQISRSVGAAIIGEYFYHYFRKKNFFFLSKLVFLRKPCFLFLRDSDGTGGRPASGQQEVAAAPPSRTCAAGRAPGHLVGGTGSTGGGLRGRRAGTGTCSQQHPREQTGPLQVHAHVCAWTPDLVIFVQSSPERRWTLSLHFDSCLNHLLGKS